MFLITQQSIPLRPDLPFPACFVLLSVNCLYKRLTRLLGRTKDVWKLKCCQYHECIVWKMYVVLHLILSVHLYHCVSACKFIFGFDYVGICTCVMWIILIHKFVKLERHPTFPDAYTWRVFMYALSLGTRRPKSLGVGVCPDCRFSNTSSVLSS